MVQWAQGRRTRAIALTPAIDNKYGLPHSVLVYVRIGQIIYLVLKMLICDQIIGHVFMDKIVCPKNEKSHEKYDLTV